MRNSRSCQWVPSHRLPTDQGLARPPNCLSEVYAVNEIERHGASPPRRSFRCPEQPAGRIPLPAGADHAQRRKRVGALHRRPAVQALRLPRPSSQQAGCRLRAALRLRPPRGRGSTGHTRLPAAASRQGRRLRRSARVGVLAGADQRIPAWRGHRLASRQAPFRARRRRPCWHPAVSGCAAGTARHGTGRRSRSSRDPPISWPVRRATNGSTAFRRSQNTATRSHFGPCDPRCKSDVLPGRYSKSPNQGSSHGVVSSTAVPAFAGSDGRRATKPPKPACACSFSPAISGSPRSSTVIGLPVTALPS